MRTSTVVTISIGTLVTGALGYAVYFDYKRRNDPSFRSKLKKDAKRTERAAKRQSEQREKEVNDVIENTVNATNKPGALPQSVQEKEEVFMQSVQIGETLVAQGSEHYLNAAAAFYRGLKVYPKPAELLLIYKQAVPEQALDYVRRMVAKDPELSSVASQDPLAALAQAAMMAPRSGSLEDVDDESPQKSAVPGDSQENNNAPSISSQEWEKVSGHDEDSATSGAAPGTYAAAAETPVNIPTNASINVSASSDNTSSTSETSAPQGSYAAAAEAPVNIPLGQGNAEDTPQPTSEHVQ